MKLSSKWLREFVDTKVDDLRLAQDLTSVGIAVEGISGSGEDTVFEMEIGTNRPDAMNHYGVAREASVIYNLPLKPIVPKLPATSAAKAAYANAASATSKAVPSPAVSSPNVTSPNVPSPNLPSRNVSSPAVPSPSASFPIEIA